MPGPDTTTARATRRVVAHPASRWRSAPTVGTARAPPAIAAQPLLRHPRCANRTGPAPSVVPDCRSAALADGIQIDRPDGVVGDPLHVRAEGVGDRRLEERRVRAD